MSQRKIQLSQMEIGGSSLVLPAGVVLPYGGSAAPSNFLLCDGSEFDPSAHPTLYSAIGTTFNTGGETPGYFRVPDMRERVAVGKHSSGTFATLGGTTGSETTTLTTNELPAHTHGNGSLTVASGGSHTHTGAAGSIGYSGDHQHYMGQTSVEGGGGSHPASSWPSNQKISSPAGDHTHSLSGLTVASTGSSHSHSLSGSMASAGSGNSFSRVQPSMVLNYIISTGV